MNCPIGVPKNLLNRQMRKTKNGDLGSLNRNSENYSKIAKISAWGVSSKTVWWDFTKG